jgi:hypothetical protein
LFTPLAHSRAIVKLILIKLVEAKKEKKDVKQKKKKSDI